MVKTVRAPTLPLRLLRRERRNLIGLGWPSVSVGGCCAGWLRARADEALAGIISSETGKPAFEAVGFEIAYLCEVTRFLSGATGRRMLGESRRGSLIFPHKQARVNWQPHGVVAVIGPWNFPLLNNFGDAVAPLLAGNSVVLKPSPYTPQTSRRMRTLCR